jgi:hypothetical protein
VLPLRRPLTLHKLFQVKGGSDVPIGQIKQSKNQPGQIYPAIAVATAILLSRGPLTRGLALLRPLKRREE